MSTAAAPTSGSTGCAAAVATLATDDARQVVGAVADEGEPLPGERRDYQFPFGAVGNHLPARRLHDLGVEVVLPEMDAGAGLAVDPHAGATRLGHPDDVEGLEPELALDHGPQRVRPHLRPQERHAEGKLREVELLLPRHLDEAER